MKPGAAAALAVFGIVVGIIGTLLIGLFGIMLMAVLFGASIMALDSEVDTRLSQLEAKVSPESARVCPGCGLALGSAESLCPRCGRRLGPSTP